MRFNYWQKILFLTIFIFTGAKFSFGQMPPKREMRGAWIATVANIDWPSKPGLSSDRQKTEFIQLLDTLQKEGINAVFVQIRPSADAFYPSSLEPWSYWLTGKQGEAPQPYYDPLKFMIEQAHKRGMEFHAWFNPYRAVFDLHQYLAPNNITKLRPQWFVTYGDKKYFNPGLPDVWNYMVQVVSDVVKRYDIDGVHFDDYFYPYRIVGKEFPDFLTYKEYGDGMGRDEWRRHNIDTMIEMVSKAIKSIKPWVKFGVSPFGVWRNDDKDPDGSATHAGQTDYDDLYANVLKWLKNDWIDYVAPQLYWDFDQRAAPYGVLLDWWAHHTYGRDLYIGQGLYRVGSSGAWRDPDELPSQLIANRSYPQVDGSIYYSASIFNNYTYGFNDSLQNHFYRYPALIPPMPWIDSIPPLPPRELSAIPDSNGLQLLWKDGDTSHQTYRYVIYRFSGDTTFNLNDPRNILQIVNKAFTPDSTYAQTFTDTTYQPGQHYVYVITALDRLDNESMPGGYLQVPADTTAHELPYISAMISSPGINIPDSVNHTVVIRVP
jgi:uncharacterized lipoprotein YddW (UPF0748 family)